MSRTVPFTDFDKPLVDDPASSYTMPSRLYLDPGVYEKEKSAIFAHTWHYIGHESHVSRTGDYLTMAIGDDSVFVIRSEDSILRGFHNVCRHRAHQLLEGSGNVRSIVCPYHAWTYKTDGSLHHAKFGADMANFNPDEFCLPEIRVESVHGMLFVNVDMNARSVAELAPGFSEDLHALVPRLDELKPVDSFAFDGGDAPFWNANWKVVVDNYVECYHCHHAHPALANLMVMDSYEHDVHDQWARQISRESRQRNSAYSVSESDDVQIAAYWYLFPTTSIWLVPGSPNLFVLAMMPLDHQRTTFAGHKFAIPDLPEREIDHERSVYLNEILGPEDQRLCESVQKGLKSSSYNQGRFMVDPQRSGTAEQGVHHFHHLVMNALTS